MGRPWASHSSRSMSHRGFTKKMTRQEPPGLRPASSAASSPPPTSEIQVLPIEYLDLLVASAAVACEGERKRVFASSVPVAGLPFLSFGRGRLEDGRDQLAELGRGRNTVARLGVLRREPDLLGRIEVR